MKKNIIHWWATLAVMLAVYNVVVFAVPFPRNIVFFVSWLFTLAAIAAQTYVIRTAFYRDEGAKSKFYGWPIAKVGAAYLTIQLAVGLVFMALGFAITVPIWLPLMLYVVLLGAAVVGFIAVDTVRDEIERQDTILKKDMTYMRTLQSKVASMVQLAQDDQTRKILEKFAEDLRFSDPISSETLGNIEADLTACVDELQRAIADGDAASALELARNATDVLMERNRLCKLKKGN